MTAALTDFSLSTWLLFLFVVLATSRLGKLAPLVGLPLITGYLLWGAVAGPYALGIIKKEDLPRLSPVTNFALAFIAFAAGSELYLPELRALFKRIVYQTTSIAIFSFIICGLVVYGLGSSSVLAWMNELDNGCRFSVALIAASICVARSPASAIAIIKEQKAKGIFTSTLLGVTVFCDVYVLLLFTLTSTVAESECKGEGFSVISLGITIATMTTAVALGWLVGKLLIFLMMFKRVPTKYLILPLGWLIFFIANWLTDWSHSNLPFVINIEPLLLCIVAGYFCTNKSKHRHRLIGVLQQAGPYVFLPFFTLTGASLDLTVLVQSFGFAAIVAVVRAGTIFLGSYTGGYLSGQSSLHNLYMWMTLITQAGVSLGLASEVGMAFPEWGRSFQTSIIGVVLVAQLVGPILFKIAIKKVGDAGKGGADGAIDEDAEIPTAMVLGTTPDAIALATRLLKQRWKVMLVAPNQRDADTAKKLVGEYALASRAAEDRAKNVAAVLVEKVVAKPVANAKGWWQQLMDRFSKTSSSANAAAAASASTAHVKLDESPAGPGIELPTKNSSSASVSGAAGATAPAVAGAAAQPPQQPEQPHHDDHGHAPRWLIEEHLDVVPLLTDDSGVSDDKNPFLVPISTASAADSSSASSAAPTPTANPLNNPSSSSGAGSSSGSGSGSSTDYTLSRLVALVQSSSRTLQAVAAMLPSDASNFACVSLVDKLIAAAPKRSHLHSVRIVASCKDPAWASVFESATGAIPLHDFSLSVHAASRIITVASGKPTLLLPALPNSDEIAKAVQRVVIEGNHYWSLAENAPTPQPSSFSSSAAANDEAAGSSTAIAGPPGISSRRSRGASAGIGVVVGSSTEAASAAAAAAAEAVAASAARHSSQPAGASGATAAAAGAAEDSAWSHGGSAATGGGGGVAGLRSKITITEAAEEVPAWERDNYLEQLHSMGEESEDLGNLESKLQEASKTKKREDLDMYGSVVGQASSSSSASASSWEAGEASGDGSSSNNNNEDDGGMWT